MKSKIPTKAYGGATEAQYKQYGLRLPRTWKVMTSALLLLFTFAIGNVWGTATNFHTFVAAGDTIIDIEGTSTPSTKMAAVNGTDWAAVSTSAKNNSIYRMNPSTEEVATSKTNVYGTKLGSSAKSTYKVTGVSNVIFYVGTGTAGRIAKLDVTENGKSKVSEAASVTLSDKNNAYKMSYALDASKSYTLEAYASADLFCYAVKFTVAPSCDDANASIIANTSVYVNDELDLEFSSDNTNSVVYDIKKGGSATSDASVTAGVFKATVAGTYVVTATQAKDASDHCAVEESVTITVNSKTPVSSVSISGDATAYIGIAKTLTATADQAVDEYKWEVDGVDQGVNAASFNFSAAAAGTYSIVCKARNSFNDPSEYISSSAHEIVVTKLCGELIRATRNGKNIDPVTGVVGGTATKNTQDGGKLGSSGHYWKLVLASGNFMIGDVVTVNVSTAAGQGTLAITTDQAGANVIATAGGVGVAGDNELTITEAVGNTIWLSRDGTNNNWNGVVDAIYVTRSCAISDDCSIKSLTINGEAITPSAKVYSYEVAAASALTEVAVAYTIHPLATGTPTSGFNVAVPAAGDPANTQTITVTAEDGTHSDTYTISVSKATAASDVVTLDALAVTGYTLSPTFDAATLAYTITKDYGTADPTTDKVTYTKSEDAQKVEVNYDGTNHKFVITVTAEDNTTTQDYEITINEAEAPKSLSRVLFSNGFDAFIDNTNHTVKAFYLAGTTAPTATTITAGAGTAGELSEGKIRVTGADDSYVDYIVTLAEVTPNTSAVAEADPAGEFAGDEAWVKNGLLVYGNAAGYSAGDKWYVNRRLTKGSDPEDDQRVIAGWVRSYFFVGNASKFIMTVGGNRNLDYTIDGGTPVENVNVETLEIALTKGNHMIEIVSHQQSGDCRLSAPKLVELPASHTVTYMPGDGTGAWIVDDEAIEVADCPSTFTAPTGKIFNGWKDGDDNDVEVGAAVTTDMALTAQWINHYAVTFNMNGHGDAIDPQDIKEGAKATKPADPVVMGWDFGGWFTDEECTAGNEFDFETPITAATPLFAKWTAFDGCVLLVPATSGPTIALGDEIDMQTGSFGATMVAVAKSGETSSTLAYESYGLSFASSGNTSRVTVTLDHELAVGSKITLVLVANGTSGSNRALDLYKNTTKVTSIGWTSSDTYAKYDEGTFTYTVTNEDGLAGMNEFSLYRNNSVFLKRLTVEACGAAITYHNLTSEVNIADKGTVTLGATSVREGYTTTAEYSDIDPLYEFVNWTVSGAGASVADATANPATITVGTEDAVVTLNLRLIPVKFTVEYYDGATLMGSEQVAVNENPTASEIVTAKRHYTFLGWSDTDGGDVVALNTITRTEAGTVKLYAKYEAVVCPTSGTIFSMESDEAKKPGETVKVAKNGGSLDLAEYATISGGNATIANEETSDKDAISTSGQFLLKATKEVMKIELNCVLQEGDIIRIPDNNQKYVLSTSNAKTGTYQAQTSAQHDFAVTEAWVGVDDIYVLYDGSSLNFTKLYVIRPAKYDVTFNMMGHGTQIADIEDVLEGSKISAPTAPTDANYSFAGWYKENTLANEWKFDVDIVEANTTLYAKWLDKSDATLKSLKYGSEAIALEDGVFEYNIGLPAMTVSVPALAAVANSATVHSLDIADATAFDSEGKATSTVTVVSEDETVTNVYSVNFSKLAALPQVNVAEATTWDFSAGGSTTLTNQSDVVLANVPGINNDENFNSQALLGSFNKLEGTYFQGSKLSFTTEVAGKLTITFRGTNGNTRHLQACVGDGETVVADWVYNSSSTSQTKTIFVPEGKVTLKAFEGETPNNVRIYRMELNTTPDYSRDVTEGRYGTICLPNGGVMVGAMLYEVAYFGETSQKIFFDNIPSGEMEAGIPYVFLPNDGVSQLAVYYTDDANASAGHRNGLYGSYTEKVLTDYGNDYVLYNNQYLRVVDNGATVKVGANRAYIKLGEITPTAPALAPGRIRMAIGVTGHNTPTGLENGGLLNGENGVQKVLINGNLYILRGEKMFDATGRLVK